MGNRRDMYLLEWTFRDYELNDRQKFWINFTAEESKDVSVTDHEYSYLKRGRSTLHNIPYDLLVRQKQKTRV